MKSALLAVFILALAVVTAWPLSSAIGAATASAAAPAADVQPAGCVPAPPDDAAPSGEDLGLPPGHPPIPSGHPPIPSGPGPLFGAPVLLTI